MDLSRSIDVPIPEATLPVAHDTVTTSVDEKIEVPYTDYKRAHLKPLVVDYFELGDSWDEPQGYFEEVSALEGYFKRLVASGELANTVTAIKGKLKELERLHNLEGEERKVIKVGTLAAYVKFLQEADGVKRKARRYGTG